MVKTNSSGPLEGCSLVIASVRRKVNGVAEDDSRTEDSDSDVHVINEISILPKPKPQNPVSSTDISQEVNKRGEKALEGVPGMRNQFCDLNGQIQGPDTTVPPSLNDLYQQQVTMAKKSNYISQLFRTPANQPLVIDDNESVVCLGSPLERSVIPKHGPLQQQNPTHRPLPTTPQNNRANAPGATSSLNLRISNTQVPNSKQGLSQIADMARTSVIVTPRHAPIPPALPSGVSGSEQIDEILVLERSNGSPRTVPPQAKAKRRIDLNFEQPIQENTKRQCISQDFKSDGFSSTEKARQSSKPVSSSRVSPNQEAEYHKAANKIEKSEGIRMDCNDSSQVLSPKSLSDTRNKSKNPADELDPYLNELMLSFRNHVKGRCIKYFDLNKADSIRRLKDAFAGATKRIKPDSSSLRTFLELFAIIDPNNYSHEIDRAYASNKERRRRERQVQQVEEELQNLDTNLQELDLKFIAGVSKRGDKKGFSALQRSYMKKYLEYQEITGIGTESPFSIDFDLSDASPYPDINKAVERYLKREDFKCSHEYERDNFCAPMFQTILELVVQAVAEHKLNVQEKTYEIAENLYVRTIKSYKKARENLMWHNLFEGVVEDRIELSEVQKRTLLQSLDAAASEPSLSARLKSNTNIARHNYQQVLTNFASRPIDENDDGHETDVLHYPDDEDEEVQGNGEDDGSESEYDVEDGFINDEDTTPIRSAFQHHFQIMAQNPTSQDNPGHSHVPT